MNPQELSAALASAAQTAGNALVRLDSRRGPTTTGTIWAEGIVVTSDHAVEREEGIEIGLPDGTTGTADLVGRDPGTDLAVLKTDAIGLKGPAWSDAAVQVGHLTLGLWRPGRTVRATLGIASAVAAEWRTASGGKVDRYLESDIGLRTGLSGGLLVDLEGRALGLITTGLVRGAAIALPYSTVNRVVTAVLAHGQVPRGYLGIGVQPVRLPPVLAAKSGQPSGLIVVAIQENGPAYTSGMHLGDVLLGIDGRELLHLRDLQGLLDEPTVGKSLNVRVLRGNATVDVEVVVGSRTGDE